MAGGMGRRVGHDCVVIAATGGDVGVDRDGVDDEGHVLR